MTRLELRGITKSFGQTSALKALDLTVEPGELITLLGPSGCGKTTALRIVAGFVAADRGAVLLDGQDISPIPANRRDMGMVFQSYSLFPHLDALDNVAFGLRMRRQATARRRATAGEMLELVGLSAQANRYPHQLSGGQQQRVALARALAVGPRILLLDEPLSALDAKVRVNLRDEISHLQRELGMTTVFVTHDQEEAMAISDRVAVMADGRLEQIGPPAAVYREPATPFVARFVGTVSTLDGRATRGGVEIAGHHLPIGSMNGTAPGTRVSVLVRPEAVTVRPAEGGLTGIIDTQSFRGSTIRMTIRLDDGPMLLADVSSAAATSTPIGSRVTIDLDQRGVFVEPFTATDGSRAQDAQAES
jgi:putative spermidine/putrescine transport system ATP-binding protein